MTHMSANDEFAEIDVTEDEIDAMMAAGESVEVIVPERGSSLLESLYTIMSPSTTTGGVSVITPLNMSVAPSVQVTQPVDQRSEYVA